MLRLPREAIDRRRRRRLAARRRAGAGGCPAAFERRSKELWPTRRSHRATCCASRTAASSSGSSRRTGSARRIVGRVRQPAGHRRRGPDRRSARAAPRFPRKGAGDRTYRQLGGGARRIGPPGLVRRVASHLRRPARPIRRILDRILLRSCIPTIAPRCARPARRPPPTGEPYDIEHRVVRPDGSVRWVHEKAAIAARPAGPAAAHGRHRAGHHRAAPARGSAAAVAEDGSDWAAGRRHRPRSEQRADRDRRLRRARARRGGVRSCGARRRRGDPARGRTRRIGHAAAAGVQPQAAARAARVRSQRHHRRISAACCRGCWAGIEVQTQLAAGAAARARRSGTDRAGGDQPRGQCARRHAGRRPARARHGRARRWTRRSRAGIRRCRRANTSCCASPIPDTA